MREKPIVPSERHINIFNARFENNRSMFLKEQYALGNIFINEFGGIEMCWPMYMNINGTEENDTSMRTRHRNKISAALRTARYGCGEYQCMGYFPKAMLAKPDFLENIVIGSVVGFENTRRVLIEKTGKHTEITEVFKALIDLWYRRIEQHLNQ